jgi:hypothetical protein
MNTEAINAPATVLAYALILEAECILARWWPQTSNSPGYRITAGYVDSILQSASACSDEPVAEIVPNTSQTSLGFAELRSRELSPCEVRLAVARAAGGGGLQFPRSA